MTDSTPLERIENEASGASTDGIDNAVVALSARNSLRILDPQPSELILDAGCGTGQNLKQIADSGATAVGIDFSPRMLGVARSVARGCSLAAVDLRQTLPFRDGAFHGVLCSLVADHLKDFVAPLSEMRRVTKPGGRLVFSVCHPEAAAPGVEHHLGAERHSVQDYLDAVVDAGFDEVAFASFKGSGTYDGVPLLFLIAATVAA